MIDAQITITNRDAAGNLIGATDFNVSTETLSAIHVPFDVASAAKRASPSGNLHITCDGRRVTCYRVDIKRVADGALLLLDQPSLMERIKVWLRW